MNAGAGHAVMVGLGFQHPHDHLGMLALAPGRRAVFAIAGHVEHRAEFFHLLQRFQDQLFTAGEMLAGGDHREGFFAGEQGGVGVYRSGHGMIPSWFSPSPARGRGSG
jgi:hypothetical protein